LLCSRSLPCPVIFMHSNRRNYTRIPNNNSFPWGVSTLILTLFTVGRPSSIAFAGSGRYPGALNHAGSSRRRAPPPRYFTAAFLRALTTINTSNFSFGPTLALVQPTEKDMTKSTSFDYDQL